jgi:hypothetical protein
MKEVLSKVVSGPFPVFCRISSESNGSSDRLLKNAHPCFHRDRFCCVIGSAGICLPDEASAQEGAFLNNLRKIAFSES